MNAGGVRLRLPASSANLGPGFDAVALALSFHLEVDASSASFFSIRASGRNIDVCSALEGNLLIETYRQTLESNDRAVVPLELVVRNEIPLGMGCGSSAAVRLAGVVLAVHFGKLHWSRSQIMSSATHLEGHPDNMAACWLGGFAVASWKGSEVLATTFAPLVPWRILLVLPKHSLETRKARAVLPEMYTRADVVANIQSVALLTAAFAQGRGDLLATAMADRIHQPYRREMCPLLPRLLPLAGECGILGAALSGAGPAVLMLIESSEWIDRAKEKIVSASGDISVEVLECTIETQPASVQAV